MTNEEIAAASDEDRDASGMAAKAPGSVHRRIAAELGRPAETVRGWLRRFTGRVEAVRVVFTGWCRALAADPGVVGAGGR